MKRNISLAILAGLLLTASLHGQSYTVTDLSTTGLPSSASGTAYGINIAGQAVGNGGNPNLNSNLRATLFSGNGSNNTDLYPDSSIAYAINDSGTMVGYVVVNSVFQATLFSGTGSNNTYLGSLGGATSLAQGINNSGQIVGQARTSNGDPHATLFSGSGSNNTDLGTLGGNFSAAYAINNTGQIVGQSYIMGDSVFHATLFNGTGTNNTDLGTLGGTSSIARAINDSGQIIGDALTVNGVYHAALFSGSGSNNIDLGTLGGTSSQAKGINNSGQIIGWSYTASGNNDSFLYIGGTMRDLNNLISGSSGVSNILVTAINDWGQIVGSGNVSNNQHAVLLNPITPLTSVSGGTQDVKLVKGMNFSKVAAYTNPAGNGTQVSFLDGTASKNRDVLVSFAAATAGVVSDIANVSTAAADGSTQQDKFVLQLSYTSTASYLGWFDPSTGTWKNAVLGNSDGGLGAHFVSGTYDGSVDFVLGYYGVDTANHVAWAVIDHNSQFAVQGVPEPSTWALLLIGATGLLTLRRRLV